MINVTASLRWGLVVILLLPAVASWALVEPDNYLAGEHYSEWEFQGSKAKCELKHEIPKFGIGRFLRLAGEELSFRIDSFQPVPISVEGVLREISPSWEHGEPDLLTQKVSLKSGLTPVKLGRKPAAWLLSSLAKGQIGSFDFLDWDDSRKAVHVQLSPVNYQKPYREFRRCLRALSQKGFEAYRQIDMHFPKEVRVQLFPVNYQEPCREVRRCFSAVSQNEFEAYRQPDVHFPLDIHELDATAQELLRQLAEYVIADDSIKQIWIDGHADDQGTPKYNDKLSERRARSVYEHLVARGINPALLTRQAFGESRPRIRSRSEHARAANRRAEIRLSR